MKTIVGQHLYASDGVDVGEITDVVGVNGTDLEPTWFAVKTGWFGQRLVPAAVVEEHDGEQIVRCTAQQVKDAPKVPVHFEPSGEDRDILLEHYGIASADA